MLCRYSFALKRHAPRVSLRYQRAFATPSASTDAAAVQQTISDHAATALGATGRFLKFSLITAAALGLSVCAGYEAAHQYVEHWALAPETDDAVKQFQWDVSEENWHGDPHAAGTDPGLGFAGRHAVRAAWMARNWGIGPAEIYATSPHASGISPAMDFQSAQAAQYLKAALSVAESKLPDLHPFTLPELLNRYASLLERLGNDYLPISLEHFQHAWEGYSGKGLHAARIALRLGGIHSRLHQNHEAQKWWRTAVQLCQGASHPEVGPLLQPTYVPASPWAQRTLASTLVSVSAFYAQSGKLREAEEFEKAALDFLRSIPAPESLAAASPPQTLHALYILQRSSLLSIHLGEVLHARGKSIASSIQWLASAAESSERVARVLAGLPLQIEGSSGPSRSLDIPHPDAQIAPMFLTSRQMIDVASRLYRDAQRTSAEAWNLLGVLYERKEGAKSQTARECYARALQWAGNADEEEASNPKEAPTGLNLGVFQWPNFQVMKRDSENTK